ncbi:hypothetical protein A2415_03260 [candidate division WWE3 bacterium RIFOXYC1_FULL_39_7]|uniref:Uncharacterized protein n=2 Tax=Katanobacteria TaxID=422282 RepID=A0A1F4X3U0_UNCKA|nr:MAG: hypothetical protein A2415_03260 [candidate division WWE3 bacterium RIFOXYC1_FULL_39_7]OGC76358.1 MAG: hypothetical protein A2619_00150 [candidate division WWE3 bacterium RIFOXYD1_FULL_39_9]
MVTHDKKRTTNPKLSVIALLIFGVLSAHSLLGSFGLYVITEEMLIVSAIIRIITGIYITIGFYERSSRLLALITALSVTFTIANLSLLLK